MIKLQGLSLARLLTDLALIDVIIESVDQLGLPRIATASNKYFLVLQVVIVELIFILLYPFTERLQLGAKPNTVNHFHPLFLLVLM